MNIREVIQEVADQHDSPSPHDPAFRQAIVDRLPNRPTVLKGIIFEILPPLIKQGEFFARRSKRRSNKSSRPGNKRSGRKRQSKSQGAWRVRVYVPAPADEYKFLGDLTYEDAELVAESRRDYATANIREAERFERAIQLLKERGLKELHELGEEGLELFSLID